jgi:hypothetical protein
MKMLLLEASLDKKLMGPHLNKQAGLQQQPFQSPSLYFRFYYSASQISTFGKLKFEIRVRIYLSYLKIVYFQIRIQYSQFLPVLITN